MASFAPAVATVLQHEGGFVNDKDDPGGATNFGISLRHLQKVGDLDGDGWLDGDLDRDGDVDVDDIRAMTRDQAEAFYKAQFWDRYRYDYLKSQDLATKVFCLAVHAGPRRAHIVLQRALNYHNLIKIDGLLGPHTRAAANVTPGPWVCTEYRHETAAFYLKLIEANPVRMKWQRGWLNRAYA